LKGGCVAGLILIADDSPIIQRKAQQILQAEGFEVQTVSNGVAAVKKLPVMQPVLVLADVSMPGKDGYEVCEFVKNSPGLRHVPVLLVGSDLEPYDEQRGAQVRADGIIKKPFSSHELIDMVRRFAALAKVPESSSTPEEAPVAAPLAPVPAAVAESHPASAQQIVSEGGEEEPAPADVSVPIRVSDDMMSSVALQSHDHSLDAIGILSEPAAPSSESFPAFMLDPAPESGSEPNHEGASEPALAAFGTSVEMPGPAETGEFVLPPQLVDLTGPEDVPGAIAAWDEPVPEPSPVVAPEPEPVAAETAQGVEESKEQPPGELNLSQPLDESTFPAAAPEAPPIVYEPVPESNPAAAPEPASASPETSPEWGDLISSPPALESAAAPGEEWIHKVVHKVVVRMAPPVLSPEQVEELARLLTREIASEL